MKLNEKPRVLAEQIFRFISGSLQPAKVERRQLFLMCVVVFAVAVGVRLLHWQNNWLTIDNTMNKTAARYKEEALFLTEGDLTAFIRGRSVEADTGMLIHTPGYPMVIAAVFAVSHDSNLALRLVHIAGGATAVVLVLLVTAELFPIGAAVLAALFAAVSPQLSYYSLVSLPDSVIGVPLVLGVYLLVLARKHTSVWWIIGAGVCFGVSCWLRANIILLAPFLCLFIPILFPRKKWLRSAALLVIAAVLTIAPITIRNAIVFKSFIPLTLGTGVNLMEGIADYDPAKRFGMEQYDHEVARQEAILYNRPDYAEDLYRPDGILRERLRVGRAWSVIKANKVWFIGVMARRAGKMLTYEPVSIISADPSVSHALDSRDGEPAWRATPEEFIATNPSNAIFLTGPGVLTIAPSNLVNGFSTKPISAIPASDYLLSVPVRKIDGRVVIKIVGSDRDRTLASATLPDSLPGGAERKGDFTTLQVPFVNAKADQFKIVMVDAGANSNASAVEVGPIELYRLGPASYLWTKYPRIVVKAFQKYFMTGWMLPLALAGTLLLVLARRFDAWAVICAVPLYFMLTHAPIHLELRYILPINYFWGMLVATSLYFVGIIVWKVISKMVLTQRTPRSV